MNNTAVEDLFIREETLDNTVCNVVAEKTATEAAAMTASDIANGKIIKLTTAGSIGGTAYAAGDFLKATVTSGESTALTWSKASTSDIKGYIESEIRDWKRWGRDISKDLGIACWLNNAGDLTAGALTVILESSADKASWTEIASAAGSVSGTDRCARLAFFLLPRTGIKQYVRVKAKVTTQFAKSGTATAANVSIGLENDGDNDIDLSMVQPKIGG